MTADRAIEAWTSLSRTCLRRDGDALLVREGLGGRLAPIWPVSQVLAAAIDISLLTGQTDEVEALVRGLRRYERGTGYAPMPGLRRRYYDDNAWIGLSFAQLHLQTGEDRWRHRARRVFSLVREGVDAHGGIRWVEGRRSRNTCSTAPAAQLALRLRLAGGGPAMNSFATSALHWLDETLRLPGGVYADHIDRGRIDRSLFTYNQGSAVGAHALLARVAGDPISMAVAERSATESLRRFGPDRTWRHAPVFNAIWFRNLLAFDAVHPMPAVNDRVDAYLDHAWRTGRDRDGLFTAGGIGTYDRTPAIDTAGVVQLLAIRAWPDDRLSDVC
jgi:Glycosyl hydrolase family 76